MITRSRLDGSAKRRISFLEKRGLRIVVDERKYVFELVNNQNQFTILGRQNQLRGRSNPRSSRRNCSINPVGWLTVIATNRSPALPAGMPQATSQQ